MKDAVNPRTDAARRVLAALRRSAEQARLVAAQTRTQLIVAQDGDLVRQTVTVEDAPLHHSPISDTTGS